MLRRSIQCALVGIAQGAKKRHGSEDPPLRLKRRDFIPRNARERLKPETRNQKLENWKSEEKRREIPRRACLRQAGSE